MKSNSYVGIVNNTTGEYEFGRNKHLKTEYIEKITQNTQILSNNIIR